MAVIDRLVTVVTPPGEMSAVTSARRRPSVARAVARSWGHGSLGMPMRRVVAERVMV